MAPDMIIPVINVIRICPGPVPAGTDWPASPWPPSTPSNLSTPLHQLPPRRPTLQRGCPSLRDLNTGENGVPCKGESLSPKMTLEKNIIHVGRCSRDGVTWGGKAVLLQLKKKSMCECTYGSLYVLFFQWTRRYRSQSY